MPLFARLGLLRVVEVSETDRTGTSFASHSAGALGITGAATSSSDFLDLCLQHCPQDLMFKLIGHHLNTRQCIIPLALEVTLPNFVKQRCSFHSFTIRPSYP